MHKARIIDHHAGTTEHAEFASDTEMLEYALRFSNPVLIGVIEDGQPCSALKAEGITTGAVYQISKRGEPVPDWTMKPSKEGMKSLAKWHNKSGKAP